LFKNQDIIKVAIAAGTDRLEASPHHRRKSAPGYDIAGPSNAVIALMSFLTRTLRKSLALAEEGRGWNVMGNSQGRDNVKKRASRRKKTERLAAAKAGKKKTAK